MTDSLLPFAALGAGPSRRTVLRAVSVSGAAAVLAACGGSGDTGGTATDDGSDAPDGAGSSGDAGSGEGSAGVGGALVAAAEVPVGGGVILEAEKVVVTQPEEGTFKAFSAVCTHQGCTVASVKKSGISCACHGSSFGLADGAVLGGPATRPLKEIAVTVEGDQVVQS